MNIETIVVIFLLFFAMLTAVGLAAFVWRRREEPWSRPFLLLTLALAVWAGFYALEIGAPTLPQKYRFVQLQYIGITALPVGWFLFAEAYAGHLHWLRRRRVAALFVIPWLALLLAFTNSWHGWFWSAYQLSAGGPLSVFDASYGPGWFTFFAYSYLLMLIGSVVLVNGLRHFPAAYRWQLVLLLCSPVLPWVSNALYVARVSPVPQLDLAPVAFTLSAAILGLGIVRFRLFSLVPLARSFVLESMHTAMFVLDREGRIVDMNPAALRLFGLAAAPIGVAVQPALGSWATAVRPPAQREGKYEFAHTVHEITHHFWVDCSAVQQDGRLVGHLYLIDDITRQKQAETAIAMSKVKTEFLAKVGHELRTPLNVILGWAEMLDYGVYGDVTAEQQDVLRKIVERTEHLTRLVNDLLLQTQLEAGKFQLEERPYAPRDVLHRVLEAAQPLAAAKGLQLSETTVVDLPAQLLGDPTRVYQIVFNLVENAIKFTESGRVTLTMQRVNAGAWEIIVHDTGVGIPTEMHADIFNAFQQNSFSITRKEVGYGLGLSIVMQLVTLMGGEIRVESQPQQGSTFRVTLPLILPDAAALKPKREKVTV